MAQNKLSLDKKVTYNIKVPGDISKYRSSWDQVKFASVESDSDGDIFTVFICECDQAGLHGLIKSLYSKGIPLISIICEGFSFLNDLKEEQE